MRASEFQYLATLLQDMSGIVVTQDKMYLLENRLGPIAVENGCRDLDELVGRLRLAPKGPLGEQIVEAMTTNETFFFRDKTPFESFEKVALPHLLTARAPTRKMRIWCAAASSGQEPYSLAMILREHAAKMPGWSTEILGTDLSKAVLQKAQTGIYSQFEVQRGLPIQYLVKYFKQQGEVWHIDPMIKNMVRYKPFNLLEPFTGMGTWDLVFLRNVLIYFDRPTKQKILERMVNVLAKDGYVFLGAAETVVGLTDKLAPVQGRPGLFQPVNAENKAAASRPASTLTKTA